MGTESKVKNVLAEIDELVSKGVVDQACEKYIELIQVIEHSTEPELDETKAEVYASFAYLLFALSEYEVFFEMLIKAQSNGYSREDMAAFISQAFIEPNESIFKKIFEDNLSYLRQRHILNIDEVLAFDQLPFWLIPTGADQEYYLFDRGAKELLHKISFGEPAEIELKQDLDLSSDFLIALKGDLNSIINYTKAAHKQHKSIYFVIENRGLFLSCLQGYDIKGVLDSNIVIFDQVATLKSYFECSTRSLPRKVVEVEAQEQNLVALLENIHQFRLKREHRKGDRVLLSVCMPTFNRGHRAYENICQLLKMKYDEEVEFVVSNNGTKNETLPYYEQIKALDDSRIVYFEFAENQGFSLNCCKVCELAVGKYILLISDEDALDLDVLDRIMSILRREDLEWSILKASSTTQSKQAARAALGGGDALLTFMLSSNYMSGMILNNQLLKLHKGIEFVRNNQNNSVCYYYPHMYWELLLCQYVKVEGTPLVLVHEGKAERTDINRSEEIQGQKSIPSYATIEGRLEQHKAFYDIFTRLDACKKDFELFKRMYMQLCIKTLFLVRLSIQVYYSDRNLDQHAMLDRALELCTDREFYKSKVNGKFYNNDFKEVKEYYHLFKSQL